MLFTYIPCNSNAPHCTPSGPLGSLISARVPQRVPTKSSHLDVPIDLKSPLSLSDPGSRAVISERHIWKSCGPDRDKRIAPTTQVRPIPGKGYICLFSHPLHKSRNGSSEKATSPSQWATDFSSQCGFRASSGRGLSAEGPCAVFLMRTRIVRSSGTAPQCPGRFGDEIAVRAGPGDSGASR